jgi:hypothetical protein
MGQSHSRITSRDSDLEVCLLDKIKEPSQETSKDQHQSPRPLKTRHRKSSLSLHVLILYVLNVLFMITALFSYLDLRRLKNSERCKDPSLRIYCKKAPMPDVLWSCANMRIAPANNVVEYYEHHFTAALFNQTKFMGFQPTRLINCGLISITVSSFYTHTLHKLMN